MKTFRRWMVLIPVSVLLLATACSSKGSSPTAPGTEAPATGENVPVVVQEWSVTSATVPAGSVTFAVSNQGDVNHEFVVLRTDTLAADIPIKDGEIDEDEAGTNIGEVEDVAPGATQDLTLTLDPGHYVFLCNLPTHYGLGMNSDVTVA